MHRKTLQKVIDELNKDNPRLDYVKGILETLIEQLPEDKSIIFKTTDEKVINILDAGTTTNYTPKDEGALLDAEAKARLKNIVTIV